MESASPLRPRIDWVDTAKAFGIYLVFYGHFVERVYDMGNEAALPQQKLIYAFHMPLFFLISGFLAKAAPDLPRLWPFLRRQATSRLLPVVFFSLVMIPFSLLPSPPHQGPAQLRARHIGDWPGLCARVLEEARDAKPSPGRQIWDGLSAPDRRYLESAAASGVLEEKDKEALVASLNAVLARRGFYQKEAFARVQVSEEAGLLLGKNQEDLTPEEVQRLNLAWFRAAYPEQMSWHHHQPQTLSSRLTEQGLSILRGKPELNTPVWFLVCLFTVELIHFATVRFLSSAWRTGLAIPLFACAGWFVSLGATWQSDIWFFRESVFLYSFFLLGFWSRQVRALERGGGWWSRVPMFVAGSAVLWLTFGLNPGSKEFKPVVLINLSQHGDPWLFAAAAVAGSLAVVGLARLVPSSALLSFLGRHTLILMGLNGIFYGYLNSPLVGALSIAPSPGLILFWCTVVTLASLALCLPVVWLLDRYLPQLVGRPRVQGPLLPPLA